MDQLRYMTKLPLSDFLKDVTQGDSNFVELLIKLLSILNVQKNADNKSEMWCISAEFHCAKTIPCKTTSREQYNITIEKTSIKME